MSDATEGRLADGSAPATPDDLFRRLDALGIATRTVAHAPVFTVEEARAVRTDLEEGGHVKNLFLRNHKKKMFLLVCDEERPIDLKALGKALGWGKLSFGSPERLMRHLGVVAGAVTPFAAINDPDGSVRVAIDRSVLAADQVRCHPLDNARTTAIAPADLVRFLEAVDHPPEVVDLEG